MATSQDEVFGKVREVLEDALGVDEDEVNENSTLGSDLGAESIDILDIQFRLEKAFNIKIEQGEMIQEDALQNPDYVADGKVTEAGLAALRERMPYADLTQFEEDPDLTKLLDIFTVNSVVRFVMSKLDG